MTVPSDDAVESYILISETIAKIQSLFDNNGVM